MNNLNELINKLCPNGVEYKKLEDLLEYEQPTKYLVKSTKYDDNYKTPVLTAGQSFILGYTGEDVGIYNASEKEPVIIFDDFTTSFHWVDFEFKVKSSAIKMLRPKIENVNFKYIYYAMSSIFFIPETHSRHWISVYSQLLIPMPPLEIQCKIVNILNEFSLLSKELEKELSAEKKAREKQYEYYKNELLKNYEEVDKISLKDIAEYSRDRINASELNDYNYVGVDNLLQNKMGKINSSHTPKTGNSTKYHKGDILIGNIRPYLKKIWLADRSGGTNGDVLAIHIKNNLIIPEYLYYILSSDSFFDYDNNNSKGAKMPRGNKEAVMNYKFYLPNIDEQNRIINILSRFEKVINNISEKLPAEIEARQKQYEYYRDKLLNFKELKEE